MTKTKQKYQNYKDSEVDWIAKVPKTWGVERVKSVIKDEQNGYWGSKEQNDENDVKCIRVADFDYQKLKVKDKKDFTVRNLSSDKIENLSLQKNDLLIEKSGGGDKTPVGRVVIFDKNFEAICSNFIARLKTRNNCDNKFLNYVFAWLYYIDLNTRSIKQTTGIQNLDTYQYFCEKFPLPPKKEQQKIANYLDEKTSKIDKLIEKNNKLIELLKEKRQAVITKAVTKGIDRDTSMKDSGVEWIGEIPKHWEENVFGRFMRLHQGLQIDRSKRFHEPGKNRYKYITVKFLNSDDKKSDVEYIEDPRKEVMCDEDDILLARTGATGEVITDTKGVFHNNFFLINFDQDKIIKDFLVYFLKDKRLKELLKLKAGVTTIPDLNHGDFLNTSFLLPPKKEQKEIIGFLNESLEEIDKVISKVKEQNQKLKEYKKTLISKVVTGKIKIN